MTLADKLPGDDCGRRCASTKKKSERRRSMLGLQLQVNGGDGGLVAVSGFHLAPDADDALVEACDSMLRARAETFGNGRAMRTLWERTREAQAGRVMRQADRTAEDLVTVEAADIGAAASVGAAA